MFLSWLKLFWTRVLGFIMSKNKSLLLFLKQHPRFPKRMWIHLYYSDVFVLALNLWIGGGCFNYELTQVVDLVSRVASRVSKKIVNLTLLLLEFQGNIKALWGNANILTKHSNVLHGNVKEFQRKHWSIGKEWKSSMREQKYCKKCKSIVS